MEVRFHIDEKTVQSMTWEEFEAFERAQDGDLKMYQLRPVLARFMVADDGKTPLPHRKALGVLGELPLSKVQETIEVFVNTIRDGVIPKENASLSRSPSEAEAAVSEFPDGSEPSNNQKTGDDRHGKSQEKS